MDEDLRKQEVLHRFLVLKQNRGMNFFWAKLVYSIIIWFCTIMCLLSTTKPRMFMWGIVGIIWIISFIKMVVSERNFITNLKRKMFEKEEPEVVDI